MTYQAEYFDNTEQVANRLAAPSFDPLHSVILERNSQQMVQYTEQTEIAPESHVLVLASTLNSITIDASTNIPGWLVVSEIFYPGWKAYVDGQETPISKADLALRAIELYPGHHIVKFIYDPDSFRYGLILTLSGAILVVSLTILLLIRQLKEGFRRCSVQQ
jgi:uncharacterized membrane protein YfhO